ncbi:hypothetical protein RUND412_004529 [Rhizina undulata]
MNKFDRAREIVKRLGELPLALGQAGAYISELQLTFSAFRERMDDVFNEESLDHRLPSDRTSIRSTWELSFKELSPEAQHLLHLCAFLRNEDILDELFRRGKSAIPWIMEDNLQKPIFFKPFNSCDLKGENNLDKAIRSLFTFSFAKRKESGDAFWIHPLVHSWAREHTDLLTQRQNAEDTIALVGASIAQDDDKRRTEDWIFERRILSHIKGCHEHISQFPSELDSIKVAEGLSNIATAYAKLSIYKKSEELLQRAIEGFKITLGKDHLLSLDTIQLMGTMSALQSRYDEGLEYYRRALSGKEKAFRKADLSTLYTVNEIASVLRMIGRNDEALEFFHKALAGRERVLGSDHCATLDTIHYIARIFSGQGRYNEALERFRTVLAGSEKAFGMDHPDTVATVYCIGEILQWQERYDDALEWYRKTLAGEEKSLGKGHRDTLQTVYNIAKTFEKQRQYVEAREWYRKALAGREKALGKDHPDTRNTDTRITAVSLKLATRDVSEGLEKGFKLARRFFGNSRER